MAEVSTPPEGHREMGIMSPTLFLSAGVCNTFARRLTQAHFAAVLGSR